MPAPQHGAVRAFAATAVLLCTLTTQAFAAPVRFDPRAFFAGRNESTGRLKVIMRAAVDVRDESEGRIEADGTLALRQVVHEGTKPARTRLWRIRETSPGRYTGTINDAKGPVVADLAGSTLHIAYTGIDGYGYEQWITLAPDGRSARHVFKVRKMGMAVAELNGTIRKID